MLFSQSTLPSRLSSWLSVLISAGNEGGTVKPPTPIPRPLGNGPMDLGLVVPTFEATGRKNVWWSLSDASRVQMHDDMLRLWG
jgi:hypothetical protein